MNFEHELYAFIACLHASGFVIRYSYPESRYRKIFIENDIEFVVYLECTGNYCTGNYEII